MDVQLILVVQTSLLWRVFMSYSTCEDDIRRILVELPSENHCIDYKLEPYRTETYPEFIRDVIAFLNCAESFNEDRYIVIGVGESQNSRVKIGIDVSAKPMPDDNEFQNMIDMIRPRPAVQTGTYSFEDKMFGYIHILRSNIDTTYEVSKTFPSKKQRIDSGFFLPANAVHEGQAYIRLGTKKVVMNQLDRRRIENPVRKEYTPDSTIINSTTSVLKKSALSIDLVAALIGTWNNTYEGDRQVIEQLSGLQYTDWEVEFQKRIAEGDKRISFSQGLWSYAEHSAVLILNSQAYFETHLSGFYSLLISVLKTYDREFDLPADQRLLRASNTQTGKYSKELREALILSFVNIATKWKEFTSCTKFFIKNNTYTTIKKLMTEGSWKNFTTLNWQFVNISQADPDAFFSSLQEVLKTPDNEIVKYLKEKENGIVATGYYHGLVSALQTLTWSEKYFSTSSRILFSLCLINEEIENSFIAIFLPWYPQTEASLKTRVGVIKSLVSEFGIACWDVIYKLMPHQTLTGVEISPPLLN